MGEFYMQMFIEFTGDLKKVKKSIPESVFRMLKKKKSSIIRKILKYSKLSSMERTQSLELKSTINMILKILTDEQLDVLLKCLQCKGGIEADCLYVENETKNLPKQTELRHVMAEAFRFPGIRKECFFKNLSYCSQNDIVDPCNECCINPYHLSLVVDIDSPLPPYAETQSPTSNRLSTTWPTKTTANTSSCSTSSSQTSSSASSFTYDDHYSEHFSPPWCRLTYWEMKDRIGPIFDARLPCINVFENLPQGPGLNLSILTEGNIERNENSVKICDTIGYGFQLTKEEDSVWLYNRSELVLFVGSPTFQVSNVNQPVVKRLMPGNSILVCNPFLLPELYNNQNNSIQSPANSPNTDTESNVTDSSSHSCETTSPTLSKTQPFCVRVSFGKGWGMNYTRMSITQCPCWVEIYLNL